MTTPEEVSVRPTFIAIVVAWFLAGASAPALAQSDAQKKLLADADRIAADVAKMRGLKLRRPIKRGVMNREQITAHLLKRVKEDYAPDELATEEMALKRFGLLPAKMSYLDTVIELLKQNIAGFYDPKERQLFIADWMGGDEEVMAHEIDHALQDQHFDLERWMKAEKKNADASLARQALVEGDGTVLMFEFQKSKKGEVAAWGSEEYVGEMAKLMRLGLALMGDYPVALKETLVFPYVNGLKFVANVRKTKPWSSVDAIYKRPPLSTEHIVHFEKFEAYEQPIVVTAVMPKTLAGYKRGYDNVSGELNLWLFLQQHGVDVDTARTAVAGWGGDRIAVYTPPGYDGVVSTAVGVNYTVWDAEADAVEYFAALVAAMPKLSGGRQTVADEGVVQYKNADGAICAAERRGDSVLLIVGAPPARADELRGQVWKTWTIKRP